MKIFITFSLTLFCFSVSGQLNYPSKKVVNKIIRITKSQLLSNKNPSCEYGQCGKWLTANSDSAFYKSDTLKFYNSSNIVQIDTSFCQSKIWIFVKYGFYDSDGQLCKEPTTETIWRRAYKHKIISKENITYIIIYADEFTFETYKVTDLRKMTQSNLGDESFCLTLVRQSKK